MGGGNLCLDLHLLLDVEVFLEKGGLSSFGIWWGLGKRDWRGICEWVSSLGTMITN